FQGEAKMRGRAVEPAEEEGVLAHRVGALREPRPDLLHERRLPWDRTGARPRLLQRGHGGAPLLIPRPCEEIPHRRPRRLYAVRPMLLPPHHRRRLGTLRPARPPLRWRVRLG